MGTIFWRRVDAPGLERLEILTASDRVLVEGSVIFTGDGGLRLEHRWALGPDWRTQTLDVERWGAEGRLSLRIEREGARWRVDGALRADLEGADEPDISATPFCNSLPIRRLIETNGQSLTLDTVYVEAAALAVSRSRQRYDRKGPRSFRYVDLGAALGFEAYLETDETGLVTRYQHLFEQIVP